MADLHAKTSAGVVTVIILVSSRPNDLWAHLLGIYAEMDDGFGRGKALPDVTGAGRPYLHLFIQPPIGGKDGVLDCPFRCSSSFTTRGHRLCVANSKGFFDASRGGRRSWPSPLHTQSVSLELMAKVT
jgi:hypothetical protein